MRRINRTLAGARDRVLQGALDYEGNRGQRRAMVSCAIDQLAATEMFDDSFEGVRSLSLKAMIALAVLPAVDDIIDCDRVRPDSAISIEKNLRRLAIATCSNGLTTHPGRQLLGTLSELSILNTFWHGIVSHNVSPGYVLPTDSSRDRSSNGGLRDGIDLVGRTDTTKLKLQVKSGKVKPYYKHGITIVSPHDLCANSEFPATRILKVHADGNDKTMGQFYLNLITEIQKQSGFHKQKPLSLDHKITP